MRVLVVGAGIAGLYKTYSLLNEGHSVKVLEKTDNIGGQLHTIKYESDNGEYYFDIGPHVPPRFHKIWNSLCERVDSVNIPLPIKSSIKINPNFDLAFPPDLSFIRNFKISNIMSLIRYIISYYLTSRHKIKEKNLEDSLINLWGLKFYQKHMQPYMSNFWKFEVSELSEDYKARVVPPRIKYLIQIFIESLFHKRDIFRNDRSIDTNGSNLYLYPKYGCKGVIDLLGNKIVSKKGIIEKRSIITDLNLNNDHIEVQYKNNEQMHTEVYDKIYWAASISDLLKILNLNDLDRLTYRKLVTINISVNKKDLLGDKVHTSYIMIPNIIFHRVTEPNKFSPFMAPKNSTSATLEVTLDILKNDLYSLIEKSINQFCALYDLNKSEIEYLGEHHYEEAYPLLFIEYNEVIGRLRQFITSKTSKFSLIGRTGHYFPYNIVETLESTF